MKKLQVFPRFPRSAATDEQVDAWHDDWLSGGRKEERRKEGRIEGEEGGGGGGGGEGSFTVNYRYSIYTHPKLYREQICTCSGFLFLLNYYRQLSQNTSLLHLLFLLLFFCGRFFLKHFIRRNVAQVPPPPLPHLSVV